MADLRISVHGVEFPNPFVIGSGPPSTNARVISRCFDEGWGGVVAKTVSLEHDKVVNVAPRYGKLKKLGTDEVVGFENIELISDRPFDVWLDEFRQLKKQYRKHILIASIMEEYEKSRWQEITRRVQETGVDLLELNLSCPHGHPERQMGAFMGQNPDIVKEVVGWVKEVATVPVWAKMTPNVGNVAVPAQAAFEGGADGVSAINTILSIIGVDLQTLRPQPTVQGFTTPGGYSYMAVKPIALKMISDIALRCPGKPISGIGGITESRDALEFMLLGSSTVQVCTGVMLQGHEMVHELMDGVQKFMVDHKYSRVAEFVGQSLQFLTTHHHLVELLVESKKLRHGETSRDHEWGRDNIVEHTDKLTANR